MTALSLANLSENRFLLGLGNSGPQIVEGLHGVSFEKPLTRMRETVEIIRMALPAKKSISLGSNISFLCLVVKDVRLDYLKVQSRDPDLSRNLRCQSLRFTGEAADGWIGTSFTPEYGDNLLDDIRWEQVKLDGN